MNLITFNNVLPHVFANKTSLRSEVWNQQLTLRKGNIYLIEAHSGKGKSTFCSYLVGYRNDYAGNILFDQQDIISYNVKKWINIRQQHISYIFQELRLFPELTALENVMIKNNITHYKTVEQIRQWFDELGIADKLNQKVAKMSFGQQQRVAMMRALVQPFDFLLADEPISHLDNDNAEAMAQIILREVKQQGAAMIVTSIGKHMLLNYDKVIRL